VIGAEEHRQLFDVLKHKKQMIDEQG